VNSGVVAFRIAARPPVIRVCPQKIRLNGIRVVQRAHCEERGPERAACRHAPPGRVDRQDERDGGEADPGEHQGERPHFLERHLGKKEGATPENRQRDQKRPLKRSHGAGDPSA
jgi:hypothetical protein